MSTNLYIERFPRIELSLSDQCQAVSLGLLLASGLTFVAPALTYLTPVPILFWVGIIGLGYGLLATFVNQFQIGLYASLLVTMTFAADVPLVSHLYLSTFTRDIGPAIWLADLPLLGLLGVLLAREREQFIRFDRAEVLFGGFICWVLISAVFARPPRFDAVLYFSLFLLQGWLVFVVVRRSHSTLSVSPETTLRILSVTVLFKAAFGFIESVRGGSFGFTHLGELSSRLAVKIAEVHLGPLGVYSVGTFVSGFSGMSFILASLIVLTLPFVFYRSLYLSGWRQAVGLLAAALLAMTLRLTGTDAGRGGAILALGVVLGWIAYHQYRHRTLNYRNMGYLVLLSLVCFGVLFMPSTQSGAVVGQSPSPIDDSSSSAPSSTQLDTDLETFSLPFFDVSHLGVRLQQYVAGIAAFLDNPLFGVGGTNFPYINEYYGIHSDLPIHNVYISLLAETGIVGFGLYAGFLIAVLWNGFMSALFDVGPQNGVYLSGFAAVVGYLGFMFWDYMLFDSIVSSFTFYAVCAVLATKRQDTGISGSP